MKISAVIIAKNEESTLPKLLESLYCRVDEIVIVDTGSQDKTKEIAKAAADAYGEYEWNDDFSAARNYAKSLATNEWILSIDCDEVLSGSVFLDESQDALTVRLV